MEGFVIRVVLGLGDGVAVCRGDRWGQYISRAHHATNTSPCAIWKGASDYLALPVSCPCPGSLWFTSKPSA